MRTLKYYWKQGVNSTIARRFVLATILCSTLLAVFITGIQLYVDYRGDLSNLNNNLDNIEVSRLPSLIESLWKIDEALIKSQLQGILQVDGVEYAAIINEGVQYSVGNDNQLRSELNYIYPLTYSESGRIFDLGELEIIVSLDQVYKDLLQRGIVILISNSIKTLLVATFIIIIYQFMIGQHLATISSFTRKYQPDTHNENLKLQRRFTGEDELSELQNSINHWIYTHKIYQEKLQQANERYDVAVKGSSVGLWDWDISHDTLYWSDRFKEIIGIDDPDFNANFADFEQRLHTHDREATLEAISNHLTQKTPFNVEYRLRHNDGQYRWIHARGQAIWDTQGNAIRMAGSIDDITTSKLNDLALQKNLAFQELLLSVNTDLIFVKDQDFRITNANPAFLNLYPEAIRDSIIGSTTIEEYDRAQADEFLKEDRKAFTEGMSEVTETIDFPDGHKRTLLTKKIRFEDINNKAFILCIARDISQIKKTEEALVEANAELEEFAYRTSHDLRSPLISSTKLLSIIQDSIHKGEIEKASNYLDVVQKSLKKLEILVTDILIMARLNHAEMVMSDVDTQELINQSLEKFSHMEGYDATQFFFNYETDQMLTTQKEHLTLIVENLLSNAIKYQNPEQKTPSVNIATQVSKGQFVLTIADNGLGIAEKFHDNLFKMFKRFHAGVSFGSGLGLYMVKKSVDKIGGTIQYRSNGEGSEFTVYLPLNDR